jgi:ubiquinone/menaquinone biosynthesis C-methylase UbiE
MKNSNETKTDFLIARINQNENNQTVDINKWAFDKIPARNEVINILELCCGTGKQTEYLVMTFPKATITCLDISVDAINTVKEKFRQETGRMNFYSMGIDEFFKSNKEQYDIIFCSYGLYYSKDIEFVLSKINGCLNPAGRFYVMGPYGDNNKQLFDALAQVNVKIPDPVISSSSTFMFEKVLADATKNFETIHIYTTQNNILWEDVSSVMNYWKSSTFFDAAAETAFKNVAGKTIEDNGRFINTKKIMLIEAIKKF